MNEEPSGLPLLWDGLNAALPFDARFFRQNSFAMDSPLSYALLVALLFSNCTDTGGQTGSTSKESNTAGSSTMQANSTFVEGTDHILLERARFMDEMGFEQPAEAFSVLLPKGWKHEGGILWKSLQECRGENGGCALEREFTGRRDPL